MSVTVNACFLYSSGLWQGDVKFIQKKSFMHNLGWHDQMHFRQYFVFVEGDCHTGIRKGKAAAAKVHTSELWRFVHELKLYYWNFSSLPPVFLGDYNMRVCWFA